MFEFSMKKLKSEATDIESLIENDENKQERK